VPSQSHREEDKEARRWYDWLFVLCSRWPADTQPVAPAMARRPAPTRPVEDAPLALNALQPHQLDVANGRLVYSTCQRYFSLGGPQSLRRLFAASRCLGNHGSRAAAAAVARGSAPPEGRAYGSGHVLLRTGTLVWCKVCGCYSEMRLRGLLVECKGLAGRGRRKTHLSRLLAGRHPSTKALLPGRALPVRE